MNSEIEKLISFGNGRTITETMVKELVNVSFEGKIFELVDTLSKRDTRRTIQILEEERLAGSDDYYILSMFSRQIRLLISARSLLETNSKIDKSFLAKELNIHPFVATKILVQAKNFTLDKLLNVHNTLFSFDQGVKNGEITINLAVDLIATKLLSNT
jgi:DNA polymerase-3 subunit delta